METKFHKQLTEIAPKVMDIFCKAYGYTLYNGQYYCNYLIEATKPKADYVPIISRIISLQNNYDSDLEHFKLKIDAIINHLEANNYRFASLIHDDEHYVIRVFKKSEELGQTKSINYFDELYQHGCLIALKDLEATL